MHLILYLNTRELLQLKIELLEIETKNLKDLDYIDKLEMKIMDLNNKNPLTLNANDLIILKKYNIDITKYKSKDIFK